MLLSRIPALFPLAALTSTGKGHQHVASSNLLVRCSCDQCGGIFGPAHAPVDRLSIKGPELAIVSGLFREALRDE
jgi:hypothetical protein